MFSELKADLGLQNYYNHFLPNLFTLLAPMHQLLKNNEKWVRTNKQDEAFRKSEEPLQSAGVLGHYSADRELILACDASSMLPHMMPDETERPLGFMSRTLISLEKWYSHLDKEELACSFRHSKIPIHHRRKFTITTDHKPLMTLFHYSSLNET